MTTRRINALLCLAIMLLLPLAAAQAADITVDADCSLENAVRSANGVAQVAPYDNCEAGDAASGENTGADTITITVEGTVDGTITLDASLSPASAITIEGNGYTIDGAGARVLDITAGSITLNAATVTGGWANTYGGGIRVNGAQLTLNNSVVRHNGAARNGGGILAYNSDLTLIDSAVISNVTGVASMPASDDDDLVASGWTDARGGGIHFNGANNTLTVQRSGISGNRSIARGGGVHITAGKANIENTTISGNSATGKGGGVFNGSDATLTHVTVIENKGSSGGGVNDDSQLKLYNSILTGNTGGDCMGALNANVGNLIRDGSCDHDGLTDDPLLLLLSGAPAYYQPDSASPVIDAADASYCLADDQRGILRGQDSCDIGAAEYTADAFAFQIQSARAAAALAAAAAAEGDEGEGESDSEEGKAGFATAPDVPGGTICNILPAHIVVADASSTTQCKEVGEAGVGNSTLINGGFIYAVDIFGYVSPPVNACFAHDSGSIVLLDAAFSPRAIVPLPTWTDGKMRCATVDRPGTAVLMPQGFMGAGDSQPPAAAAAMSACTVTTTDALNLRAEPNTASAIRSIVSSNTALRSTERSGDWYRVSHNRVSGWLHGEFLTTSGDCG